MTAVPPCRHLGRQCHALKVLLRIGSLEDGEASLDHEGTWLLGHTGQITFGEVWTGSGDLYVEALLHVPCRHLALGEGKATCRAHGFTGREPEAPIRFEQPRQLGADRFWIMDKMQLRKRPLPPPVPKVTRRSLPRRGEGRPLPVLQGTNPCEGAPCTTADHRRGAACCRDLQLEIMCTKRQKLLEALVRHRKSPYLCKVEREGDFSLCVEMISACAYLEAGGVACTLHGRKRRDGRTAKPDLCFDWPPKGEGLHPGCVFRSGG
jgi:hypothetical protein